MLHIGSLIKKRRIREGLLQSELAERAGISERTLSALESGNNTNSKTLFMVLAALGILERIVDVIRGDDIEPLREAERAARLPKERKRVRKRKHIATKRPTWGDEI